MEHVEYSFSPNLTGADVVGDFKKLVSWLAQQKEVELTKVADDLYKITYANRSHTSHLSLNRPKSIIELVESRSDSHSISVFKGFAIDFNYQIYNHELESIIPVNLNIRDLTTLTIKPEFKAVFDNYNFEPLFLADFEGGTFFVRPKGKEEIHIVNPYLINYYLAWKTNDKSQEFSYSVAPNIQQFSIFAERGLIPENFYRFYGKDLKVFNYSGIDINNPRRKIFVKPFIFEISDPQFRAYLRQSEKGALLAMDKIIEGETFDQTIIRILKDLGIAEDYIRARVRQELEFDKDRNGYITPRLIAEVFVEKIKKAPAGSDRSWES